VGQGNRRRWIFYGRGWGHGLGMCQTGAYGMALEGATFQQILQHYYPGTSLQGVD
jgi:stage II sporulation protein D